MHKSLLLSAFIALPALAAISCSDLDEGINAEDLRGTVVVPKALVGTNGLGMVYVGVYSGLDSRFGYPSPEGAPVNSNAGGDTFPYGGTSIGTFLTRDYRFVCTTVTDRDVVDAGANWELPFEILQFPFVEGARVWAWVDQDLTSCNPGDGYRDYRQMLLDLETVTPDANGTDFVLTVPATEDLAALGFIRVEDVDAGVTAPDLEMFDEGGRYWEVLALDNTAKTITVTAPVGGGGTPEINGSEEARLFDKGLSQRYYGTQYNDVLNFPSKYLGPGDLVSSDATSATLDDLSPVTVTIDTVVP